MRKPTCSRDFCHLGSRGRCCLWTQLSFGACIPRGRCRPLQPTAGCTDSSRIKNELHLSIYIVQMYLILRDKNYLRREMKIIMLTKHTWNITCMHTLQYELYLCGTVLLPGVHPKEPWSCQRHESDPPSGTTLGKEQWIYNKVIMYRRICLCVPFVSLHEWYLCQDGLGGCPQQSGRRERSWGNPHQDQTRPPAGPGT